MTMRKPIKGKFPNGLAAAIERKRVRVSVLARKVDTNRQNIARWRDQEQKLPLHMAQKIAPLLDTTAQDLMVPPVVQRASKRLVDSFDPDQPDDAPREPRMVEGRYGRDLGEVPKGAILQVDVNLGMGGGGIAQVTDLMSSDGESYGAEGISGWWLLPDPVVRGRFRVSNDRIRCFDSTGDSMFPTIMDGDIVFVDVGHRVPSPPGIYALSDPLGGVVCKRLEVVSGIGEEPVRVAIISDNPKHPAHERTLDEIAITGRYLGRLTTS